MTISLKEFFLHEENTQTYLAQVNTYAVPGSGDPTIADRHLEALEHVGVAPHVAAQIMIRKYGWQDTGYGDLIQARDDHQAMTNQNSLGEHQDPTKPVDKGASIWSDPKQPVDVRKFSSCGGNLHIDLSEAPDEPSEDELNALLAGFDDPEADFGEPATVDPRWSQSAGGMDWNEFKKLHPKEADELRDNVIDDNSLLNVVFKVRPEDDRRNSFFLATFPDSRKMVYIGDGRGWQDMGGDDSNDPDDPGEKYDEPVNF